MTFSADKAYPLGEPGVIDLGDRHFAMPIRTESTDGYLWWHDCSRARAWSWIGPLEPHRTTGRVVMSGDPLTVQGALVCPSGCGERGFIESGRWHPAGLET